MNQDTPSPTDQLQMQIAEHRKANAERRARAFVDGPDRVMGIACRPMTLSTWTMLHTTGSRFVNGGTPLEGDVRNYLWFHSRLYMDAKWWTVPTFAKWFALLPFAASLHRKRDVDYYCAVIALAGADIYSIIAEVFADSPHGGRRDGSPPQGCLEAQLTHLFVKEYGWSVAKIRKTPLARLIQLARQFSTSDDEDPAEKEIKFAHLRRRNAELQKEREANKLISDLNPKL